MGLNQFYVMQISNAGVYEQARSWHTSAATCTDTLRPDEGRRGHQNSAVRENTELLQHDFITTG